MLDLYRVFANMKCNAKLLQPKDNIKFTLEEAEECDSDLLITYQIAQTNEYGLLVLPLFSRKSIEKESREAILRSNNVIAFRLEVQIFEADFLNLIKGQNLLFGDVNRFGLLLQKGVSEVHSAEKVRTEALLKLILTDYLHESFVNNGEHADFTKKRMLFLKEKRLNDIWLFIEKYFDKDFSIKMLANHLGLSEVYTGQYIKNNTGKTFLEWVEEMKMHKSLLLLCQGNLSVSDVAKRLGYSDQAYFGRRFKIFFGSSPGKKRFELMKNRQYEEK